MGTWLENAIDQFDKGEFRDGDMLSHDWIKFALQIPPVRRLEDVDAVQWMLLRRVDDFRTYLLTERKIALANVRGDGYRIVPPQEQAYLAVQEAARQIKRGIDKGMMILGNTRLDALSTDERKRHLDATVNMQGMSGIFAKQRRSILEVFKAPRQLPKGEA